MKTLPILFRKIHGEITAVFPTEPGEWYQTTKRAKPSEYTDLLAELRQIYEEDEDEPVKLLVKQRISPQMREERFRIARTYGSR